ncbi:MAG TPA: peptide MFS transporter [Usitatibacter sp.]|jgi:POT family proton-dependent oligopeptide transporter|nr:peptide MFS transporter [Usitatibacter sp.]
MAATGVIDTRARPDERQPRALPTIFFTEMWERFSYYGMRALLVLYLVNALGYERSNALEIYGLYTGLVYLSPLAGGWLADRYLGTRKAVLIGGITMALGHFAMAFEPLLYLALGLLIAGNGFFKPNMATLLGTLYHENDPRRDGGFTIYYMGVNLGAFFSPLVAGTLGERVGWHYGFASAGVGMCFGIAQFLWGQERLGNAGMRGGKTRLDARDWMHVALVSLAMIPLVYLVIGAWKFVGPLWDPLPGLGKTAIVALIVATLWGVGHVRAKRHVEAGREPLTREEWEEIIAILVMGFFVIFFWMGFEQAGGTMNLFADKLTDRHLLGWEIPASYFQAINPLAILALGPVMAALWLRLDTSRFKLPTPAKMAFGLVFLALGFVVLAIGDSRAQAIGQVGPLWLTVVYLLHTVGELCLSPVGLSMVTKLAPARVAALMMGIWYLANAAANYLAGILEDLLKGTSIPPYWFLVASSLGAAIVLFAVTPLLKRLMHGKG